MIHELKTWPEFFEPIRSGSKTFEIRKNDRGFQTGDFLALNEWDPETRKYSGESIMVRVTSILPAGSGPFFDRDTLEKIDHLFGLKVGYVAMSIKKVSTLGGWSNSA